MSGSLKGGGGEMDSLASVSGRKKNGWMASDGL